MSETQLLSCPFCGGQAETRLNQFTGDHTMAVCKSCGASAFYLKWNKRVPDAHISERTEQVERTNRQLLIAANIWNDRAEAGVKLAGAASYCIERLSELHKGKPVRDLDEASEAYKSALKKFMDAYGIDALVGSAGRTDS